MTIRLKQSTASQEIPLGYFVDSTDGNTEETALTIANTDIKLWKAGATTLANKNSGGATHIANGIYYTVLDATDTDTLGALVIYVHVVGALAVKLECEVLAANVYDSLITASDKLQTDAVELSGDSAAADNLESACDGNTYNVGGGAIVAANDVLNSLAALIEQAGPPGEEYYRYTASSLQVVVGDGNDTLELLASQLDEIQAKTDNLPADPADESLVEAAITASTSPLATAAALATVDSNVDSILADTGTDGVIVAAGAKTGYALTSTEHTNIADAILKRDFAAVTGESSRSLLNALRFLRNKWSISGTTLTVTKEDDATAAWTATLTTDGAADPVIGSDPA